MKQRFTEQHVDDWQQSGFAIIPGFFTEAEIAPVRQEYERIYGTSGSGKGVELNLKTSDEFGDFRQEQFTNIDTFPFDASAEMNLLCLHPQLIALAGQLLSAPAVHMYQSHTWAKYTGETDYDQTHHCDFPNHTLLVPAENAAQRTVDIIIYITDVTDTHGALHYVSKQDSNRLLREGAIWAMQPDQQAALKAVEKSAAGPAGTVVAHSIDTFHRGTNLTQPDGHRFTMTVGYKSAGNDMIGYNVWQASAGRNWAPVFEHASPQQLSCLGIPLPGSAYWNERTLKLSQARWPDWDMREYFEAAGVTPSKKQQASNSGVAQSSYR